MTSALGPWIVAGMHRSGTSLITSALASGGIDPGEDLLPADQSNSQGYFEDVAFLNLDRRMLVAAARDGTKGHPDWGWTEDERLDRSIFAAYSDEAKRLVASRTSRSRPWGFKDPRASLLLDFWLSVAPDARFVLPYRLPWEVADSMQRLGADVFLRRPDYAYRIWTFYNRHLLEFHRRHPERTILFSVDAAVCDAARFAATLNDELGLSIPPEALAGRFEPGLLHRVESDDPLVSLACAAYPECAELLAALDEAAALPATSLWNDSAPRLRRREDDPRVTIVIPCFEDGEVVIEAIASVERSVKVPYEVIVIDDGSQGQRTTDILEMLRAAGSDVRMQPHHGLARARNSGFRAARAPFVIPLDADNRLLPDFVEHALAILEKEPEVAGVYGDRAEFGTRNGVVEVGPFDPGRLVAGNYIDACAVIRREAWDECGGYDESMPIQGWEDWDLWLGMIRRGRTLHWLPRPGFEYRVRPGSMLHTLEASPHLEKLTSYVVGKHQELVLQTVRRALTEARSAREARDALETALTEELADRTRTLQDTEAARSRLELEAEELSRRIQQAGSELAHERDRVAGVTSELQQTQSQLQQTQSQLQQRHGELQQTQSELQQTQSVLQQTQSVQQHTQSELQQTQSELQQTQDVLQDNQKIASAQVRRLHDLLEVWRSRMVTLEKTRAMQIRRATVRLRSRIERRSELGPAYPCVIGATGGSGTRVFARVAAHGGLAIGQDRNGSEDAMVIERFFDRWLIPFWTGGGHEPPYPSPAGMDDDFAASLVEHFAGDGAHRGPMGWKSPRSIYLLPFWAQRFPELRFLHVVRDGRDMALSNNQLQLARYNSLMLSSEQQTWSEAERSIALWSLVNGWAATLGEQLGPAYMRMRFEDLCSRPASVASQIHRFFDLPGTPRAAVHLVEPPKSLGRWRRADPALVTRLEEIAGSVLRRFGYEDLR